MTTATLREELGAVSADRAITTFNILVYGDPGAGKTHFAGTAQDHPNTTPVLFLDVEGGTATLRKRPDIDVVQVRSTAQVVDIYNKLESDQGMSYQTVCIDSLSELQRLDIEDIMREVKRDKGDRVDEEVPSQREYLKSQVHMRKIVRAFKDLPCNVIFTSLMRVEKDEGTGKVTVGPNFSRKLAGEVAGFLDVVAYLDVIIDSEDKPQRRFLVQKTEKTLAKDRLGISKGAPIMMNPDVPEIWNNLNE